MTHDCCRWNENNSREQSRRSPSVVREIDSHGVTMVQDREKTVEHIVIIETGIIVCGVCMSLVLRL